MAEKETLLDGTSRCETSSEISTLNLLIWSKRRVYKNLLCISFSIYLLFIGFRGVASLQSTINSQEGIGLANLAVLGASTCISSLLFPEITIRKFGCKLTLVLSILLIFPYIISNFYPEWETLMTSAVFAGLSSSLLWPASFKYLNNLTVLYKGKTDRENLASTSALFFGILDMFFLFASTTGNLMSYIILDDSKSNSSNVTHTGCGIKFVDHDTFTGNNTNLAEPSKNLRNTLIGIYSCFSLLAVVPILLILDPLPKNCGKIEESSTFNQLTATLKIMKRKRQLLLMPFALYFGMQEAFYFGDFTRVYVACALGVHHVGLEAMYLTLSAGFSSSLSGRLRKYVGRLPIFAAAALANIGVFVQLFLWTPHRENPFIFFIITGIIWGIFHGIYLTQIKAFYGDLFRGEEESAFANFYVWSSIGRVIAFSYSKHLFIVTKIYLLILAFCVGQVGYLILECDVRSPKKIEEMQGSQNLMTVLNADEGNEETYNHRE